MTPDQICSFVANAQCCANCGEVFDSANHPHTDADCDKGYALWEVADQEMIAARLHRYLNTRTAELEAENDRLRALLKEYREKTPLGHQPHMIAARVDAALGPKETDE